MENTNVSHSDNSQTKKANGKDMRQEE